MTKEETMISLADQKRRIDKGELTPEAALAESLAAIDINEKTVGAFAHRAQNPRAQTEGPLRGIAVGIKDIIDTSDMPTEMGSAIYRGHRPAADASCVALARAAGAVVLGKTVTTEFATFTPGKTANPRNPSVLYRHPPARLAERRSADHCPPTAPAEPRRGRRARSTSG